MEDDAGEAQPPPAASHPRLPQQPDMDDLEKDTPHAEDVGRDPSPSDYADARSDLQQDQALAVHQRSNSQIASIGDRLAAISSKHSSSRRTSSDTSALIATIAAAGRSPSEPSLSRIAYSPPLPTHNENYRSDDVSVSNPQEIIPVESVNLQQQRRRRRDSVVDIIKRLKNPAMLNVEDFRDPMCLCSRVFHSSGDSMPSIPTSDSLPASKSSSKPPSPPTVCVNCTGLIHPIFKILKRRSDIMTQLTTLRARLAQARVNDVSLTREITSLNHRVTQLNNLLDAKSDETQRLYRDLQLMSEKVIDEIDKRKEIQASKDALREELEELTKSLFEQANVLVADEKRKKYQHEVRGKSLEEELAEVKGLLGREQIQLKELKAKMEEAFIAELQLSAYEAVSLSAASTGSLRRLNRTASSLELGVNSPNATSIQSQQQPPDPIDPMLFQEFKEFMAAAPNVNRIHTLSFMKNALEDDVNPCLKFGANPRTSTRRLVDAIAAGSCFVKDMSSDEVREVSRLHQTLADAIERYHEAQATAAAAGGEIGSGSGANVQLSSDVEKTLNALSISQTETIFQKTMLERISTWTVGSTISSKVPKLSTANSSSSSKSTVANSTSSGSSSSSNNNNNSTEESSEKTTTSTPSVTVTNSASAVTTLNPSPTSSTPLPLTNASPNLPPGLAAQLPASLVISGCSTCGGGSRGGSGGGGGGSSGGTTAAVLPAHFKITANNEDAWVPICASCRDRLSAVCGFYAFVNAVRRGMHSSRRPEDCYLEVMGLRRRMFYARIGCGRVGEAGDRVFFRGGGGGGSTGGSSSNSGVNRAGSLAAGFNAPVPVPRPPVPAATAGRGTLLSNALTAPQPAYSSQ